MEKLVREAQELFQIHLTGRQVMALVTYERELLDWNQKFNLTAIKDAELIRTKHFLEFTFVRYGVGCKPAASPRGRWNRRRFPGTSRSKFYIRPCA